MTLIDDIIKQLNLDTIPIRYPVVPYEDLVAEDTYGRRLLIPDDIPPTLSAMSFKGPTKPRLATGTDDGALNVNIHATEVPIGGGGGGGGGINPLKYGSIRWSQANVGEPTTVSSLTSVPTYILGYTVSWRNDYAARTESAIQLYITDQGGLNPTYLGQWHMLNTEEPSDVFLAQPFTCMFPFPISVALAFPGATGLEVVMSCSTLGVQSSGLVHYA